MLHVNFNIVSSFLSPGVSGAAIRHCQSGTSSPLDTSTVMYVCSIVKFFLKRMQTAPKGTYAGMVHCAGGILKNEGPLAFYKVGYVSIICRHLVTLLFQGTLSPLLGIGLCVSIQFGALEYTKRYFSRQNVIQGKGGQGGLILGGGQLFVAGVFAGLANGVVSGPVEHIRIRESSSALHKPQNEANRPD